MDTDKLKGKRFPTKVDLDHIPGTVQSLVLKLQVLISATPLPRGVTFTQPVPVFPHLSKALQNSNFFIELF